MTPLYRKIAFRLVPFLMLLYMVAFLDRVNISFAALTMNRDLGISDSLYGFAAGIFFLGYCLFEVPANAMLNRIGARRWLAILMVAWGVVSVGTAFVGGRTEYIVARCLLGVAEAGFFPGVIFYLTLWLPRPVRARIMALFLLSLPMCNTLGSPISSHILLLDHMAGLRGWQWLFIIEGSPAILLGAAAWLLLADGPRTARWLTAAEKDELAQDLVRDETEKRPEVTGIKARVVWDAIAYFLMQNGVYGLSFWLPKILAAGGVSPANTGWWATLPYGMGAVGMIAAARLRSRWWVAMFYLGSAVGFAMAALSHSLAMSLVGLSLAACGTYGSLPLFWGAATGRMNSKVAGAAIATVNSIGVLGGFVGPYAMGWLRDATHSYSAGLWAIAASLAVGVFVVKGDGRQTPNTAQT